MLLTITYYGQNTSELGYLLHKNPSRPQKIELSYGNAYVFYPCVSNEKTTAALLLDINPIDLSRGKIGSNEGGLFDYVNDRPYVSSSFLSTAISKVFGTAMSGRADSRQALSDSCIDLEAIITMLPCKTNPEMLNRVFEPLGYTTKFNTFVLDEKFPEWGNSRYVNLTIRGNVRLRDLLNHVFVLIPVFDRQKHYYIGEDEIEKLLHHSQDWLTNHPEKEFITSRYLKNIRPLVRNAYSQLASLETNTTEAETTEPLKTPEKKLNLNDQRLNSVVSVLKNFNVDNVIDIGCGEGKLLQLLLKEKQFTRIAGTDVSYNSLHRASEYLKLDEAGDNKRERIKLFQSSITYKDVRLKDYDAACVIEVIEHLDLHHLTAFEQILFGYAKPKIIILTTPNHEYNVKYENIDESKFRHNDHRFEWTRKEFKDWANKTAKQYGYSVTISEIGEPDEALGASTQMGVFTCE